MRGSTRAALAVGFVSMALVASACGGGGTPTPPAGSEGGKTGGEVTVAGCTPENALIPGNTSETCGGDILDAMTAKLIDYKTEDATPSNDIAESIETKDSQNFTVKLKPYKFQDGTEVTSKSFVDAWNYTAYAPNGQAGAGFMSPFAGWQDLQCPDDKCAQKPKTDKMSGLKVVDDKTFTIQTAQPVSNLVVRLGYSAFAPLPDSFFKDPKAFEKKPIGAGPFKMDTISNTEFVLSKFAEYSGENKASADKLTFRIYQDPAAAYADAVAGSLDYIDDSNIPSDQLVGEAYKSDFPDRTAQRDSLLIGWVWFSGSDPKVKDPEIRKALSMAIDRDLIVKQIFNGTRTPATGWVSPDVEGYKPDVCGEACKFDPAKAKAALEKAGGFEGTLTMTYNADSPNKPWSEAVCNSIKNTLGINCVAQPTVDFATFNKKIDANEMQGIFRGAWQADYPSIENYLTPLYTKAAFPPGSNWGRWNNPKFDELMTKAAAAPTAEEGNVIYQEAEALLAEGFPNAPLWYYKTTSAWSDRVTNVKVSAFGVLDFAAIQVK